MPVTTTRFFVLSLFKAAFLLPVSIADCRLRIADYKMTNNISRLHDNNVSNH
jgi:hypothetical protein